VTVQLANELKGEGFTVMAMHPGMIARYGTSFHQSRSLTAQLPHVPASMALGTAVISMPCPSHGFKRLHVRRSCDAVSTCHDSSHAVLVGVVATDMFHSFVNSGEGLADMFKPLSVRVDTGTLRVPHQLVSISTSCRCAKTVAAVPPGLTWVSYPSCAPHCKRPHRVLTPACVSCAQISPEQSVSDQLAFLATASQGRDNGRFVDNLGNAMDW